MSSKTDAPKSAKSLAAFMKDKAKADCAVCKLPPEIRAQLGPAASKLGFSRPDQLEWLHRACGASSITMSDLTRHLNSHHEEVAP